MNQETPTFESKSTAPQNELLKSDPLADALEIQDLDLARNPEAPTTNIESTPQWAPQQEQGDTAKSENSNRYVANTVKGAALTAATLAAAAGIVGLNTGGSDRGEEIGIEVTSPTTIELNDVANLRNDPEVENGEWSNSVLKLDAPVTIQVDEDLRRLDGTNNGTWHGIPVEAVEEAIPTADLSSDKDGYIWVNEQGVNTITIEDSSSETTSEQ